jgi:hypothetical protein
MGQLVSLREYPTAAFESVTAPNADTLYTSMWLDVTKEPWIVSLPDMKGRYALPGKRTTAGTGAQQYAITVRTTRQCTRRRIKVPLSAYGKRYTPPPGKVDSAWETKTPPRDQVNALDAGSYFKLFAELLKTNRPTADNAQSIASGRQVDEHRKCGALGSLFRACAICRRLAVE